MAARPRIRKRANWPDGLHEPRPGYYTWRDPRDKKTHVLGRMPLAQAIHEAQEANLVVANGRTTAPLSDRLSTGQSTVSDLIRKMPTEHLQKSTLATQKYIDKSIRTELGEIECAALTTKHIADLLERFKGEGKMRRAQAIRDRLISLCSKGASLGWMEGNPALITEKVKVRTKRRRLRLEEFNAIYEKAPEVAPWLQNAMLLALVSGQDRSTIGRWQRASIANGIISVRRSKTSVSIEIPLELRLDAVGMSLGDVIARCKSTGIVSKYLIHHIRTWGDAVRGGCVKLGSISGKFAEARALAGIEGEGAPTFHEIRSLAKRLYDAQGGIDTKTLLGHMTDEMAELYANNRGLEPLRVKIG